MSYAQLITPKSFPKSSQPGLLPISCLFFYSALTQISKLTVLMRSSTGTSKIYLWSHIQKRMKLPHSATINCL